MTATESRLKPEDTEFFAREIDAFLPDRVFDAHTHLWKREFIPWQVEGAPADIGYVEYQQLMRDLHPQRRVAALFIPAVHPDGTGSFTAPNEWVAEATAQSADCRHLFFVRPEDDPEWVREEVKRLALTASRQPGDVVHCWVESIGAMDLPVRVA